MLIARCKKNKTDVYVNWNSYMGSDKVPVAFRFGENQANQNSWSPSTDGTALFAPDYFHIKLLRRIVESESTKLTLRSTPFHESPVTAVFDTTGAKESLMKLSQTCNWKF